MAAGREPNNILWTPSMYSAAYMIGARKLNLILAQSATPDAALGGPRRSSGDTLRVLSPQTLLITAWRVITAWRWTCGRAAADRLLRRGCGRRGGLFRPGGKTGHRVGLTAFHRPLVPLPVRGERVGQLGGEAAIAAVVHVQSVGADHRRRVGLGRLPTHDLEAAEQTNPRLLGDVRNQAHHLPKPRTAQHPRGILRV